MSKKVVKKAPQEVYVEIGEEGNSLMVYDDPGDAENNRTIVNRLARYKFDGFVTVEIQAIVTEVK